MFSLADFSISKWLVDAGYNNSYTILPDDVVNTLLDDLGVTTYLLRDSCVVASTKWIGSKHFYIFHRLTLYISKTKN